MKRHLLVTNDFPPKVGGIQNYLWELWRRLDPASFVVLTASSRRRMRPRSMPRRRARGIRIERVPGDILFFPTPAALAAVRAVRPRARRRPRPARSGAPARTARAHGSTCPTASSSTAPRSPCPAGSPAPRAALAHVLRGASWSSRPGRYPAAEARRAAPGLRAPMVEIPPGVDTAAITPLRGARAPRRPGAARPAHDRAAGRQREPAGAPQGHGRPHRGGRAAGALLSGPGGGHRRRGPRAGPPRAAGGRRVPLRSTCSAGSATRTGPRCSARPTSSSWRVATAGSASSRRASASSSSRRPRPGCPRSPGTAAERPRRWSTA